MHFHSHLERCSSLAVAIAFTLGSAACGEGPTQTTADGPQPSFDRPPWAGGGGGGDKGGPLTVTFKEASQAGGFGIAKTGDGNQDLTGDNTADGITAEGSYSLTYNTTDCAGHPLVALFDGVELNTADFRLTVDKQPDETGAFDINDRIRVDLNDLEHPDGPEFTADGDHLLYSVWFRGRPNDVEYDPAMDVQITESAVQTSITVTDEDVFVRKLRCRNAKCTSVEVLERDRCELAADYYVEVSK